MSAAEQVYFSAFDSTFLKLPEPTRSRIEAKIDAMGLRLATFPHHRLTGASRRRLRVGDYRVIHTFDPVRQEIHLLAIGHRHEIYRRLQ